jgi:hypothetical protein
MVAAIILLVLSVSTSFVSNVSVRLFPFFLFHFLFYFICCYFLAIFSDMLSLILFLFSEDWYGHGGSFFVCGKEKTKSTEVVSTISVFKGMTIVDVNMDPKLLRLRGLSVCLFFWLSSRL